MEQALPSPSPRASARCVSRCAAMLVLGTIACAEPSPRPKDDLLLQGSLYLDPETLEPYSGPVFTTLPGSSSQIEQRASLRDGHYDGALEWYFGEGRLALRELYREGKKDGPYEWYFESGQLYERGTYVNGLLEGPYEAYYESANLYERGTYRSGAFHGPRAWYLDGRLIELVTYVEGRIEGPYERYTEHGEIDLVGRLHDGQPCGAWLDHAATIRHPPCAES